MPFLPRQPHIDIQDGNNGRVSIHVRHYGRVPDLTAEFSPEVLRRAVNKWRRTSREHRILTAARKLSPTAFRLVEAHLIRERALAVEVKLERKALRQAQRASWSQRRAELPHDAERDRGVVENAEYDQQRDGPARELRGEGEKTADVREHSAANREDSWLDALLEPLERPQEPERTEPETLTQQANRELRETKDREPKISRSERKAMQRELAEREESLRDLVEFTPQPNREPSLTETVRREAGIERSEPRRGRTRDRERSR